MTQFTPMIDVVPEGSLGRARVKHVEVTRGASDLLAAIRPREYVRPGRYAHLLIDDFLVMSDTSMEKRSNYEVVEQSRGHVLIAGLGLGMILLPILRKREVATVTVVEKCADVTGLVLPHVLSAVGPDGLKLTVVEADIFEWKPGHQLWDVIYFDVWHDICEDNLKEMATLHRKYAKRKRSGGWMDSWMRDELLSMKRRRAS